MTGFPQKKWPQVRNLLVECRASSKCGDSGDKKLIELREMYEPYLNGLSMRLLMPLPSWGVGHAFRGELEAVGVGKNFFGARGLGKFEQRIQPFLINLWRRRLACPDARGRRFCDCAEIRKIAGGTPALRKSCRASGRLALVVRFRKNEIRIDDGTGQGFHREIGILTANQFFLRAAFRLHALLFLPFHFFLALLKRGFRRSHTNLLVWKRVRTARVVKERVACYQRGSRGCRGLSR